MSLCNPGFSLSFTWKEASRGQQRQTEVRPTLKVCLVLLALLVCAGSALAQSPTGQTATGSESGQRTILDSPRPREVPGATLPCTPEEATWWEDLRKAAKAVQEKRNGRKEKDKSLSLLHQGQEKSFRPPIPDSRPVILGGAPPAYSEEARRKGIAGEVSFVSELRPDGFVGEVEISQGLGHGLDENAAEAARRTVFLPAVKDRKFVSFRLPMSMSFYTY